MNTAERRRKIPVPTTTPSAAALEILRIAVLLIGHPGGSNSHVKTAMIAPSTAAIIVMAVLAFTLYSPHLFRHSA